MKVYVLWEGVVRFRGRGHLVKVGATEDGTFTHAERVACGEGDLADGTREAVNVENHVPCSQDQLGGQYRGLAPATPLHAE